MNKFFSPSVLTPLVMVSVVASVILCVMHIHYSRQVRIIQGTQRQLAAVQQRQAMIQQLASDLYAYSRTNAAIKPLLDSVGIKPKQP